MRHILILAEQDGTVKPMEEVPLNELETQTLTQTDTTVDPNNPNANTKPGLFNPQILLIVGIFVLMFIMFRGPKKREQEHKKMVSSLEKNDKVRTIGGIFGTVVDIRDDDTIVLKIDESNNTKMRVASAAIAQNISKQAKTSK